MNNGLDISEEQFMNMVSKQRDLTMFQNVVHIRKQLREYKLHKKVQYVWLSVLTTIVAALFGLKKFIGF